MLQRGGWEANAYRVQIDNEGMTLAVGKLCWLQGQDLKKRAAIMRFLCHPKKWRLKVARFRFFLEKREIWIFTRNLWFLNSGFFFFFNVWTKWMYLQTQWRLGVNSFQPLTWKKIQSLLYNSVKLNSFSPYFPRCCEAAQDVISVSQRFLLVYTPAPLSPSLTSPAISFLKCLFIWLCQVLVVVCRI